MMITCVYFLTDGMAIHIFMYVGEIFKNVAGVCLLSVELKIAIKTVSILTITTQPESDELMGQKSLINSE